jgi:hypothetical protein
MIDEIANRPACFVQPLENAAADLAHINRPPQTI